jgi:hypothetical protein
LIYALKNFLYDKNTILLMKLICTLNLIFKNLIFYSDINIWKKVLKSQFKNANEKWKSSILDLYVLRKTIKLYNPKSILELGAGMGISSEAIVDEMSNESTLTTFESNLKCISSLKKKLSQYKKKIIIIKSKVIISKEKLNIETMVYEKSRLLDVSNIDLIYIDGPSWAKDRNYNFVTGIPRGDFFLFYEKLKKRTIVILDGSYITRKQINRFCEIKRNKIKSFLFQTLGKKLFDKNFSKLKKWKYID